MYQGRILHGCNCINIFDPDTNLIAVYQKQADGNFVTVRVLNEEKSLGTYIQSNTSRDNELQ